MSVEAGMLRAVARQTPLPFSLATLPAHTCVSLLHTPPCRLCLH